MTFADGVQHGFKFSSSMLHISGFLVSVLKLGVSLQELSLKVRQLLPQFVHLPLLDRHFVFQGLHIHLMNALAPMIGVSILGNSRFFAFLHANIPGSSRHDTLSDKQNQFAVTSPTLKSTLKAP